MNSQISGAVAARNACDNDRSIRVGIPQDAPRCFTVRAISISADYPAQLGKARLEWLLTVDDPTFDRHHGVGGRTPGAGYTTITQGIVKVLLFEHFEPGLFRWRKAKQTIIALAFDARVPKDEQLRLFVNIAYLGTKDGQDIRGFVEASEVYFAKPFAEISDEEYLELVAMLVAPAKYNLATHPDQNHERVRRIRRLLAKECEPDGVADVEYAGCAN